MPAEPPPTPDLVLTNFHPRFTGVSAATEGVTAGVWFASPNVAP